MRATPPAAEVWPLNLWFAPSPPVPRARTGAAAAGRARTWRIRSPPQAPVRRSADSARGPQKRLSCVETVARRLLSARSPPIIAQGSRLIHAYKTPFDATRRYGQFCATWAAQPTRRAAKHQQHRRGQLAEQDRPGRAASPCWNSFRRGRSARNAACYRARSRADVARGAPWWRPERICRLSAPPHQRPWGVGEIKGEDDSG